MTTLNSASSKASPIGVDLPALEALCSIALARCYGQEHPAVWCEDQPGEAAWRATGVVDRDRELFRKAIPDYDGGFPLVTTELAFSVGFRMAIPIVAAILGDPLGDVSATIASAAQKAKAKLDEFYDDFPLALKAISSTISIRRAVDGR